MVTFDQTAVGLPKCLASLGRDDGETSSFSILVLKVATNFYIFVCLFPSIFVWPPLVEMMVRPNFVFNKVESLPFQVVSLEKTNTSAGRSLAKQIANNFLNNVLRSIEFRRCSYW